MNGLFLSVRIWRDFFAASIVAWRKPKVCTSCNELTYTITR